MLKQAANELLTQVGRATAVDAVIRRYWIPVLLREEIPDPTAIPCADRGAPLFFRRNERSGLRCMYHGWKFTVDGHCTDMPKAPPASTRGPHPDGRRGGADRRRRIGARADRPGAAQRGETGCAQGAADPGLRLVGSGLTPMQAIVAGAARAAELLGLADRIGAVKPGYFADLLVVRGDPVSNITATRSVALVIKSGRIVFAEDPSLPPVGL
jgi:Amidohydrolase family/Rieske [2Fe-2S] domain